MLALAEAVARIEMQVMYSAVNLVKFAQTETAGYSAWGILKRKSKQLITIQTYDVIALPQSAQQIGV
jgi:hypothetical protein